MHAERPSAREQDDARQRHFLENEGVSYRLLVESVKDYAIFMLDIDGRIVTWNEGAHRIKGYTADEVIGRHFSLFFPPEALEEDKPGKLLQEAVREGRVEDEGWRVRKNGARFWASVVITALRGRDGAVVGFVKITRDMTKRRQAEERLRESEERFRLLVESVKDYAIFMLDPDGIIVSWNPGAERIKGYTADEIIGKHFSIFYPPDDVAAGKPERELREAIEKGRVEDEGWRVRKDGTRFFADVVISAIRDEHGELRGFAKVTRDLTEKRNAEGEREALMQARIRAEETSRAKDEFLMTLSHELRTPMTSILGWARLLASGELDKEETRTAIRAILQSSTAQAGLIDDVLDVSRLISGKMRLRLRAVDLRIAAEEAVATVSPIASAKKIELALDAEPDVGMIPADPDRLRQIIWNLVSNAIKFSEEGQKVLLRIRRVESDVQIIVEDQGEGIGPEFLPFVFEPFLQADSSSTRPHGGLGLGLSIVRSLTHLHGGSVRAESDGLGRGARFIVTLPIGAIVPGPWTADDDDEPLLQLPVKRLDSVRVLYVDDHEASRLLVSSILRHAGAVYDTAATVSEAAKKIKKQWPDVVVTDIAMPESDGFDLLAIVREREKSSTHHTPVIALTAFGRSLEPRAAAFDAWMKKPVEPSALVAAIAAAAASKR